jgi:hypothetical protein
LTEPSPSFQASLAGAAGKSIAVLGLVFADLAVLHTVFLDKSTRVYNKMLSQL